MTAASVIIIIVVLVLLLATKREMDAQSARNAHWRKVRGFKACRYCQAEVNPAWLTKDGVCNRCQEELDAMMEDSK